MSESEIKPGSKLYAVTLSYECYIMAKSQDEAEDIAEMQASDIIDNSESGFSAVLFSPLHQLDQLMRLIGNTDSRKEKALEKLGLSQGYLDSLVFHKDNFDVTVKELIDFAYAAELEEAKNDKPVGES